MSIVMGFGLMLILYVRRFKTAFDEEQRTIFFTAVLIVFILVLLLTWLTNR